MGWRDDIADRARNGDVEGVLKIYDDLEEDRQRVRAVNAAHLVEIRRLAGAGDKTAKTPAAERAKGQREGDVLEACARARGEATDARKAATARVGKP
jgi:hypothetical protein